MVMLVIIIKKVRGCFRMHALKYIDMVKYGKHALIIQESMHDMAFLIISKNIC